MYKILTGNVDVSYGSMFWSPINAIFGINRHWTVMLFISMHQHSQKLKCFKSYILSLAVRNVTRFDRYARSAGPLAFLLTRESPHDGTDSSLLNCSHIIAFRPNVKSHLDGFIRLSVSLFHSTLLKSSEWYWCGRGHSNEAEAFLTQGTVLWLTGTICLSQALF